MQTVRWILEMVISATLALAGPINQGTTELSVSGSLIASDPRISNIQVMARGGYFMVDCISIGLMGTYAANRTDLKWSAGVFGELNFPVNGRFIPFAGTGASYAKTARTKSIPETTSVVLDLYGGAKWFISDDIALALAYVANPSTRPLSGSHDVQQASTDSRVELKLLYYFN